MSIKTILSTLTKPKASKKVGVYIKDENDKYINISQGEGKNNDYFGGSTRIIKVEYNKKLSICNTGVTNRPLRQMLYCKERRILLSTFTQGTPKEEGVPISYFTKGYFYGYKDISKNNLDYALEHGDTKIHSHSRKMKRNLLPDRIYLITIRCSSSDEYYPNIDINYEIEEVQNGIFILQNVIGKPIVEIYKGICVTPNKAKFRNPKFKKKFIAGTTTMRSKQMYPRITIKPRNKYDNATELLEEVKKALYPEQIENINKYKRYRCYNPYIGWGIHHKHPFAKSLSYIKNIFTKEEFIKFCNRFFI